MVYFNDFKSKQMQFTHLHRGNRLISTLVSVAMLAGIFVKPTAAFAQELPELPPVETMESGIDCVITAYYSPLPDQEKYVTGDFESEKRLEGNGTHGASGRPVFTGMVAASKQYPFGTKVYIPGFGLGEVQDRGGAIKGMCRLDIWMGRGDEGLSRALSWGRRTVNVRIFLPDRPIPEDLQQEAQLLKVPDIPERSSNYSAPKVNLYYKNDLTIGIVSEQVKELEQDLKELGYFSLEPDNTFDIATGRAVFAFQEDKGIVTSQDSYGAGYFGYRTRSALSAARNNKSENQAKPETVKKEENVELINLQKILDKGENGPEVLEAQMLLDKAGYFPGDIEKTGIYGNITKESVYKFQKDHQIVAAKTDKGAGQIGPVTAKKLIEVVKDEELRSAVHAIGADNELIKEVQLDFVALGLLPDYATTGYLGNMTAAAIKEFQISRGIIDSEDDPNAGKLGPVTLAAISQELNHKNAVKSALKQGDRGDSVREIQQLLADLEAFTGPISGYYGPVTADAVLAMQKKLNIVSSKDDTGAGMVGPVTKKAFLAARDERLAVAAAHSE
jgi:peptidoglycan hydrolase-like protein with peptidoglycan-binding domain/3D (Asp-Asp-Asp) domain-containing protein